MKIFLICHGQAIDPGIVDYESEAAVADGFLNAIFAGGLLRRIFFGYH